MEASEVQAKSNMETHIKNLIKDALKNLGIDAEATSLEHPADIKMGDYSTNVAMAYAKALKMNPKELAEKIALEINKNKIPEIEKVEVAGFGFINFYLSREFFTSSVKEILNNKEDWGKNNISKGKKIMVEYTDPNPFKPFHIGHLMTNAIGESLARITEFSGADTVRANYQGDVGMHVAKSMYGIFNSKEYKESGIPKLGSSEAAIWIGECYSKGSDAYDNDADAKKEIESFNKKVYDRSDAKVNEVYDWGRGVTLEAFEEIYKTLGTKFKHYFFESVMAPIGEKIVRENMGNVFEESEGAIVFHAENYDPKLHTRVFITSLGIPLYETKEIGLTVTKFEKEQNLDLSIVVTAIEQGEYMKVVAKAMSLLHPELEMKMKHITHGMMRLTSGKMSSRKGNVITGESLLRDSISTIFEKVQERDMSEDEKKEVAEIVGVSALKYSILKSSMGSDIIYDFDKSISFEGDSGPYLQYTAVRASAIIRKAKEAGVSEELKAVPEEVTVLEHMLYQFPEVVARSYSTLEPHHIATYLTELASAFNSFYGNTQIIDINDSCSSYRVSLVKAFYNTMKNGLYLLGIKTPEKM